MPNAKRKSLRDIVPNELAVQQYDHPQYKLLRILVRKTLYSFGRFPAWLRQGDFIPALIEEAVTACLPLLGKSDDELTASAKSICRHLIHRERVESRWWETDSTGKKIHRSKSTWRLAPHTPVIVDGQSTGKFLDPCAGLAADMTGRFLS